MTTTTETSNTTVTTIRDFLALPCEALPSAVFLSPWDDDSDNPWAHLRDYIRPYHSQRLNHLGESVYLTADRDGWRNGVTVTLS